MKIGILTITPNIGFGGLLQAYALQNVLEEITEAEVCILNYRAPVTLKQHISHFAHAAINIIFKHEFAKFTVNGEYNYRCQNLLPFHAKELKYTPLIHLNESFRKYVNQELDAIVVGSDQVWRPKYVLSIYDYFLSGIYNNIKKLSYAASFGVDEWEFDDQQTDVCAGLIKKFDYVSVREKSGVALVKDQLKYDKKVYWDLDPTMLADSKNYSKFCIKPISDSKYFFTYVLDNNSDKEQIAKNVSAHFGKRLFNFNTGAEDASKPLKERIAPKLEDWISGIYYSDFVITDSFHGCVFSIIFNKPFIVYVNKARGAGRFTSLLSFLGLENRLIYSTQEYDPQILDSLIDWKHVNERIRSKREEIRNRLSDILTK